MSANSVLVVCNKAETAAELGKVLVHAGFSHAECAVSANEARRKLYHVEPDLVVISAPLMDDNGIDLVMDLAEKTDAGILLIVKRDMLTEAQYILEKTGALVLSKPLDKATLQQTAKFASTARKANLTLAKQVNDLKKKMDERKLMDKAKWHLIERLQMTENQAHRYIQKRAMDTRQSLSQVANEILEKFENDL